MKLDKTVDKVNKLIQVSLVSAEGNIYQGEASHVLVSGELGEMGIVHGHAQLLSAIKPGHVRVLKDEQELLFYISGGFLEVQPTCVTILADTAQRAADLDELAALEAKKRAERLLTEKHADLDYATALVELARASAQIRAIQALKKRT